MVDQLAGTMAGKTAACLVAYGADKMVDQRDDHLAARLVETMDTHWVARSAA